MLLHVTDEGLIEKLPGMCILMPLSALSILGHANGFRNYEIKRSRNLFNT